MGALRDEEFEAGNGVLVDFVVLITPVPVSEAVLVPMLHVGPLEVTPDMIAELVEFQEND